MVDPDTGNNPSFDSSIDFPYSGEDLLSSHTEIASALESASTTLSDVEARMAKAVVGVDLLHSRDLRTENDLSRSNACFHIFETEGVIFCNGPVGLMHVQQTATGSSVKGAIASDGVVIAKNRTEQPNTIGVIDLKRMLDGKESSEIHRLPATAMKRTDAMRNFIVINPQDPFRYADVPVPEEQQPERLGAKGLSLDTFPGCEIPSVMRSDVVRVGDPEREALYLIAPQRTGLFSGNSGVVFDGNINRDVLADASLQPIDFGTPYGRVVGNDFTALLSGENDRNEFENAQYQDVCFVFQARPSYRAVALLRGTGPDEAKATQFRAYLKAVHQLEPQSTTEFPATPPLPANMRPRPNRVEQPVRTGMVFEADNYRDLARIFEAFSETAHSLANTG